MSALAVSRSSLAVIAVFLMLNCFQYQSEALVLVEEFAGKIATDLKVNLPAEEVWNVYRSKDFLKLLPQLNPASVKQVDYVRGDGGVGTLVNYTSPPEIGGASWVDEITAINDNTMTRVTHLVKGGFLDSGFTLLRTDFRIIKKEKVSCIIRATMSFKVKPESIFNASRFRPTWLPGTLYADYINSMKPTPLVLRKEFKGVLVTEMKVNLPADKMWDAYGSKQFTQLLLQLLPEYFKQIDIIKGDGGLGTVLNVTIQPAFGGANRLDEIIVLDPNTKTRVFQIIKGGLLTIGFTEFSSGYKIIQKAHESSVTRAITDFKMAPQSIVNASLLDPSWVTAMRFANYVNSMTI